MWAQTQLILLKVNIPFCALLLTFFLLWIISVIYVLCLSCFRVCSLMPCGHLKGKADLLALVCDVCCDFVTFPFGILREVWYLIASIPDPWCLSYFANRCPLFVYS